MSAVLLEEFGAADPRAENWRYSRTALRALAQNEFASADVDARPDADLSARFDWPQTRGRRIVFVNGAVAADLSDISGNAGATLIRDGSRTRLQLAQPGSVHIVHLGIAAARPARWNGELELRAAARGVKIVEQHVATGAADLLGAPSVTLDVGDGAGVEIVRLFDLPDGASLYRRERTRVGTDAVCAVTHAQFGGRLQRHDLQVALNERARYSLRGVFALRGRQHGDVQLDLRHAARDATSDVVWRGVADQRARGILHGAITVEAGADGADARLETKNLLLSPHAEIDAQPVLEIHADEVKASHGATVGQLDERALFYLRSRGVPTPLARSLLIGGFCREVFSGVDDADLRARLDAAIEARLPHAEAAS